MTETYLLASKARTKLSREANRPEHNLRLLVAHANLLDNLMDKIHEHRTSILTGDYTAKKLQFQLPTLSHVSYIDEEDEEDEDYSDVSDSDSDEEDEDDEVIYSTDQGIHYTASAVLIDSDEEDSDEDEDDIPSDDDTEMIIANRDFRSMPTIDELFDNEELEELDSASESENGSDNEIDIVDLPPLSYDSTDESDSEEDVRTIKDSIVERQGKKVSTEGNLLLATLTQGYSAGVLV